MINPGGPENRIPSTGEGPRLRGKSLLNSQLPLKDTEALRTFSEPNCGVNSSFWDHGIYQQSHCFTCLASLTAPLKEDRLSVDTLLDGGLDL